MLHLGGMVEVARVWFQEERIIHDEAVDLLVGETWSVSGEERLRVDSTGQWSSKRGHRDLCFVGAARVRKPRLMIAHDAVCSCWVLTELHAHTIQARSQSINQSINQYSFNERHVKTQANTCMTYNWVNVTS